MTTRLTSLAATVGIAVLLLVGHFGVWAAHKTAALSLSAHELGEFTNDTPNAGVFPNEGFYLPIWAAGLALGVAAARARRTEVWLALLALAAFITQFGLPRFERWADPAFRLQAILTAAALAVLLVASSALRRTGRAAGRGARLTAVALPVLAVVPVVGYLVIRPALETLYRDSVGLGAGWWLTLCAVVLSVAGAALSLRTAGSART
ncbi:MAG: hypothetical protein K1X39_09865 [Thermoflexales bacterium]|nr:hypothetical protein [Thermoflexales bacterium]